jgi:UDP-4-amino-4,6-dideoxy-N-acetyl-beta-L-altrosamine N-acetyltransferase
MREAYPIRSLVEDDLPLILSWRNHPSVRNVMFTSDLISQDEHIKWFARANKDPDIHLMLVEHNCKKVGFVQFSPVCENGVANWGFYAKPEAPKGTGRIIGIAALDYAFQRLKLHKVCGQALVKNSASIRLHERLGFVCEGLLREHHQTGSDHHDVQCFGLLRNEWPMKRLALLPIAY